MPVVAYFNNVFELLHFLVYNENRNSNDNNEEKDNMMDTLKLDELRKGLPTLTPVWGNLFAEGALNCFESHNHESGVNMAVKGKNNTEFFSIFWEGHRTKKMERSWERNKMVEYGASCIGVLLALKKTKFMTATISIIGTGIDFWLGNVEGSEYLETLPFNERARLEISGIYQGDDSKLNQRVKIKLKQTNLSDNTGLPAYVAVVEFSEPKSKFIEKNG